MKHVLMELMDCTYYLNTRKSSVYDTLYKWLHDVDWNTMHKNAQGSEERKTICFQQKYQQLKGSTDNWRESICFQSWASIEPKFSDQTDPGSSTFTSELLCLTNSHRKHELLICLYQYLFNALLTLPRLNDSAA